jgi:hypothetical protein
MLDSDGDYSAALPATNLLHVRFRWFFASLANRFILAATTPSTRQIAFWDKVLVPVSRVPDNVTGQKFGKSIVAVWAPL